MSVWCVWNVHREAGRLPAAVDAVNLVLGRAARHAVVVGGYPTFPGPADDPETLDVALDCAELVAVAAADEIAKRNIGLALVDAKARDGDWVLILDADEELTHLDLPDSPVGVIRFVRDTDRAEYDRARLVRWRPGLRFAGRHYDLYDPTGLVATLETGPHALPAGFGVHHDRTDPTRAGHKAVYYRWLADHEQKAAV